ncbi:MAG: hypothetical protein JWQ40_1389 [Segetibacter sp.]|nr:hypothetical protein [Segetibacter sp.]
MKKLLIFLSTFPFTFQAVAQPSNCTFKPPAITIHFGAGDITEVNTLLPYYYNRVPGSCPTDGHYAYTSYTSDCFRGDWHTLEEDHTPGDRSGNMMLVNAARTSGTFLTKTINGLKSGTTYEFAVWMMNVCKITEKCPFPLLPQVTIRLETPEGKMAAQFHTGEIARVTAPKWKKYRAVFTTPPSQTALTLIMVDNAPGGCGNDFALDDITFRECVRPTPIAVKVAAKAPVTVKRKPAAQMPELKKETPTAVKRPTTISEVTKPQKDLPLHPSPVAKQRTLVLPNLPPVLALRANPLVEQIKTEAGEIKVDVYDNGEIDGDTVSIYHNNLLLVSRKKLAAQPISFRIAVDANNPHHELIMVAHNLGSIPPNTSVMVVTAGGRRHEVFISSTEKKNAKVFIDLKE